MKFAGKVTLKVKPGSK